jgi:hypothetical protein
MAEVIAGIRIPDSKLAREATDLLREHGTPLLLAHSLSNYPKTGCNPRKIQDLRAFSDSY